MLFSSLVFICAFLPLLLFIYYTAPRSWRNNILLASSLLFYAWGVRPDKLTVADFIKLAQAFESQK